MLIKRLTAMVLGSIISLTIHASHTRTHQNCRPSIDPKIAQFIIGYGSLMQEVSKRRESSEVSDNTPINIKGFERSWMVHGTQSLLGTTYLGVTKNPQAKINAVYFQLNEPHDLLNYDKREHSYCRVRVNRSAIESLANKPLPYGQYWIYTSLTDKNRPSAKYPIAQSYVDKFLSGCIELERKFHLPGFAKKCLTTTNHWSKAWVNDRKHPRTPVSTQHNASEVDALYKQHWHY